MTTGRINQVFRSFVRRRRRAPLRSRADAPRRANLRLSESDRGPSLRSHALSSRAARAHFAHLRRRKATRARRQILRDDYPSRVDFLSFVLFSLERSIESKRPFNYRRRASSLRLESVSIVRTNRDRAGRSPGSVASSD
jgi:hypothetical protein